MSASLIQIIKVADLDELKALGPYLELKKTTEKQLGFKLGSKGWNSFFQKIEQIRSIDPKNKDDLLKVYQNYSFNEAKIKLSNLIGLKITANNKEQLKAKLENLLQYFSELSFDPFKRFEETKLKNFKNSSKLEGIEICVSSKPSSLESILAKYQR